MNAETDSKPPKGVYTHFRLLVAAVMLFIGSSVAQGQILSGIKRHLEADPLTFSASLGTEFQCIYNNNDTYSTGSPFALTAFANLNIGIYGFNIPININLMNVASVQFSFPCPEINLSITPTWKKFRFHLGTSSMSFSNYTYSGLNFTGVGAEYNDDYFRIGGFYGIMQAATRFKEYDDRSAIQYMADSLLGLNVQDFDNPQFKRTGYGAHVGVGSSNNFLDLSFFKAVDDTTSLPLNWHNDMGDTLYRDSVITGKESFSLGLSGKVTPFKWLTITANLGASLFTPDHRSTTITEQSLIDNGLVDSADSQMREILGIVEDVSWLYQPRMNSQFRFAGDASASLSFSKVTTILTYRFVQADYATLGSSRFSQNAHSGGLTTNISLFSTTNLAVGGYLQRDNLDGKQLFTNQVITYTANLSSTPFTDFSLALSYSGVKQDQFDGTQLVNDSTRINQLAHNLTFSPAYTVEGDNSHTFSLNFNYVQNKNLNKYMSSDFDVSTITIGAGYDVSLTDLKMSIGGTYDFSSSQSTLNSYISHALGGNFSYTILKTDKLNLRANYTMSIAFNDTEGDDDFSGVYDPDDPVETARTNDLSFSNRLGASFTYKQKHSASLSLSSSNYSENIVIGQRISSKFDLRIHFSYNYNFAARIIKSKKKPKEDTSPELTSAD